MKKKVIIIIVLITVNLVVFSGCSNQQQTQKSENENPRISISTNITTGAAPLTVQFIASGNDSDGIIISYNWSFGDGTTSNEQNPEHTYYSNGKFLVRLSVTDDDDGSDIDNIAIIVTQP